MSTAKPDPCIEDLCKIVRKGSGLYPIEAKLVVEEIDRLRAIVDCRVNLAFSITHAADSAFHSQEIVRFFGEEVGAKVLDALTAKAEPPPWGFVGSPEQPTINHDLSFDPKPESPPASHGETQRVIRDTAAPMIRKAIGGLLFRLNDNGSLELRDEDGVIDGIDCVEIVRAAVSK